MSVKADGRGFSQARQPALASCLKGTCDDAAVLFDNAARRRIATGVTALVLSWPLRAAGEQL